MRDDYPQPVENYTDAFLTVSGAILFMAFWTIAALAGFLWVAITAWGLNRGISYLARARG